MTEKMLKFVDTIKENPLKRDKIKRKVDFDEIYEEFIIKIEELINDENRFVSAKALNVLENL